MTKFESRISIIAECRIKSELKNSQNQQGRHSQGPSFGQDSQGNLQRVRCRQKYNLRPERARESSEKARKWKENFCDHPSF